MNFHEYLLWSEIAALMEITQANVDILSESFQQPQVEPKTHDQQVQHLRQWWSNWTDPRGKIEKAKRLVQSVLNTIGRDKNQQGEDIVPMLIDIRGRLMRAYSAMPDPSKPVNQMPKLDYSTSTANSASI